MERLAAIADLCDPQMEEEKAVLCRITQAKSQLYLAMRSDFNTTVPAIVCAPFLGVPEDLVVVEGGFAELPELGLGMGGPVFGKPSAGERRIVPVDEDLAEGVLSGDFDIDSFIDS